MNYLAHLFLSHNQSDLLLGNLAADVVKGNDWQQYPVGVQTGIFLHRAIDAFTDNHPAIRDMIHQIRPVIGKYSGPVVDILCDHLLATSWTNYHPLPLVDWAKQTYALIQPRLNELPTTYAERIENMIIHNWLLGYDHPLELENVMSRFNRRLQIPMDVGAVSAAFFGEAYPFYKEKFQMFFPDMVQFSLDFIESNSKP